MADLGIMNGYGKLEFFGNETADLFTRQVDASFRGVMTKNFVSDPASSMQGFVSASVDGRYWTDTMWTRDAGVFLRELVQWGCMDAACMLAENLMGLVRPNDEGFYTFPMYFNLGEPGSGSELDGTSAIVIGMVLLVRRLPQAHPVREHILQFLRADTSPLQFILATLQNHPLIPGSGEFGGGCGIEGEFYNVVQNGLVRLALLAAASLEIGEGHEGAALAYQTAAEKIGKHMLQYLKSPDRTWIWCINTDTMQPDPAVIHHPINEGFGGINGTFCMLSDVQGFDILNSGWEGIDACLHTFDKLLSFPLRAELFASTGIWTQFDVLGYGYHSGISYGQCYAAQTMLLADKMDMATRAVEYLVNTTHTPTYPITRDCDDYFYERFYTPEFMALETPDEGCGALNLVCVAEPIKVARLIAGIDDTSEECVRIIPRLPHGWTGYRASHWSIWHKQGVSVCDVECMFKEGQWHSSLHVIRGEALPHVRVRLDGKTSSFFHVIDIDT